MNLQQLTSQDASWFADSAPIWLTIAAILALTIALRGPLMAELSTFLQWHARRQRAPRARQRGLAGTRTGNQAPGRVQAPMNPALAHLDPALVWLAPLTTPAQMLACCLVAALAVLFVVSLAGNLVVALILEVPALTLVLWGQLWVLEQRYRARLEAALPAAVSRLAALMAGQLGFQEALTEVVARLPEGPLRLEWDFILEKLRSGGVPLRNGQRAMPPIVVAALAEQTGSERHQQFLEHLATALTQASDEQTQRVSDAAEALYEQERRRSAAATELAQVRYSGVFIGGAGFFIWVLLFFRLHERAVAAYSGTLGMIIGAILVGILVLPTLAAWYLTRPESIDY